MKTKYFNIIFSIGMLCCFMASCSKMNDLHDGYLKRGETIYIGQPDSIKAFAGNGRVMLRYWISDPKASKLLVYWNSKQDSILLDIPSRSATEPVDIMIPNLKENKYFFQIIIMNSEMKNPSIPLEISVNVYGEKFQTSLSDRKIKYATFSSPTEVLIKWYGAVERGLGTNITYVDNAGNTIEKTIKMDEFETVLPNFKSDLKYRTSFSPDTNSIDIFYTEFKPVEKIEKELNRGLFARWNPPGIPYIDLGTPYAIANLWDTNIDSWFIQSVSKLPHSFTFDLGQLKEISRIKQWQRLTPSVVYRIQNVKKFELWGSATANVTDDFSGWTRLGVFDSHKPSGLAAGQESPEDLAYAAAGEDFILDIGSPAVRYIRYVVLDTWDHKPVIAIAQLKFFSGGN